MGPHNKHHLSTQLEILKENTFKKTQIENPPIFEVGLLIDEMSNYFTVAKIQHSGTPASEQSVLAYLLAAARSLCDCRLQR